MREYVEMLPASSLLLDIVARAEEDAQNHDDKQFHYEDHLSKMQIHSGVKSGQLLQGTLNISTHNFLEVLYPALIRGLYIC